MSEKAKTTWKVLMINLVLSALLTASINFQRPFYTGRVIIIGLFFGVLLVVFPCCTYFSEVFRGWAEREFKAISNTFRYIKDHGLKTVEIIGIYVLLAFLAAVLTAVYCHLKNQSFNLMLSCAAFGVFYILCTCFLMRHVSSEHPERLFKAIMIGVGTIVICCSPVQVGISWDDEIHYDRTELIPDIISGEHNKADDLIIENLGWSPQNRIERSYSTMIYNETAKTDSAWIAQDQGKTPRVYTIAYLPYDAGIIAGRALHLPLSVTFRLAKIINLITYVMIISAAAKKIKAGKMLILMIGMIPTAWFMSVNYSYDPWVISWTLYGFCCFLEFLQNKQKKMSGTAMIQIIGAYVLGCMPKAVYFVLMFPLLFMPSRVFKNRRQHILYILLIFFGVFLLLGSFTLPVLFHGAGTGDARGGSDVNSSEQLALILKNPVWYAGVLIKFLAGYLNPVHASEFLQNYANTGMGKFGGLTTVLYGLVALLDKDGTPSKRWTDVLASIFAFLVCMSLVATALYIDFTPVGLDTIAGCQYRYIIPGLASVLYMIVPDRIRNPVRKDLFVNIPMICAAGSFLANVMYVLIGLY